MGSLSPSRSRSCRGLPSLRLSGGAGKGFQTLINNFNKIVVQLAQHIHHSTAGDSRLYNFTIKNHILEHLGIDASVLNPSLIWGYPSEDFLMRVRKLVQSSVHGSGPLRCQQQVLYKYSYALQMVMIPDMPVMNL